MIRSCLAIYTLKMNTMKILSCIPMFIYLTESTSFSQEMKTYDTEEEAKYCTIVSLNTKFGLIDEHRKEITKVIYDEILEVENPKLGDPTAIYHVRVGEKWGSIHLHINQELVTTAVKYDELQETEFGQTLVRKGNTWGMWANGKEMIAPRYSEIVWQDVGRDFWMCRIGNKWGVISIDSWKEIIPCQYDWIEQTSKIYVKILVENHVWLHEPVSGIFAKRAGSFYFLNLGSGKAFPQTAYDSVEIGDLRGAFRVERKNKWGLICAQNGKTLIPVEYDELTEAEQRDREMLSIGYYNTRKGGKWGFAKMLDDTHCNISESKYDESNTDSLHLPPDVEHNVLRAVRSGLKWGVYNLEVGMEVVPTTYDDLRIFNLEGAEIIEARSSNLWGLWRGSDGRLMVPVKYDEIGKLESKFAHVRKGDTWIIYKYENQ